VIGSSPEEVRAWLVRVGVDEVTFIFLTMVTIAIPVLSIAIVTCVHVVIEAVVTIASAVEVTAIIHDFHALTCTAVKEVFFSTIVGIDFLLALLAHLLSDNLLEVIDNKIARVEGSYAPVIACIIGIATLACLGARRVIVYMHPLPNPSNEGMRSAWPLLTPSHE